MINTTKRTEKKIGTAIIIPTLGIAAPKARPMTLK